MHNDVIWWVVNIFVGACAITAIVTLYRGWAFLWVTTMMDRNSDETAVEHFLTLLRDAKESMVVHDDGNEMADGSIYQNGEVIDAVRQKLSENPKFTLSCHFNYDDNMPFAEAFKDHERVRIVTGNGSRPKNDVHYKIIDGGVKAHISRHELSSQERRYRVIDCTRVPRVGRLHVMDVLLEPYKEHASSVRIW